MKDELIAIYDRLLILANVEDCSLGSLNALVDASEDIAKAIGFIALRESEQKRNADADEAVRN